MIPLGGTSTPAPAPTTPALAQGQAADDVKRVANDFLGYYYSTMSTNPSQLLPLYTSNALWTHQGNRLQGATMIGQQLQQDAGRLTQLAMARGQFADSAHSMGGSILVQAICTPQGTNSGPSSRPFCHVFLLVNVGGSWNIQNECMQYM